MTEYYLKHDNKTDITPAHIAHIGERRGVPALSVSVYYMKDARVRGIKLSITRMAVDNGARICMPMQKCNATMNLLEMARKNDRVGRTVASIVEENLPWIQEMALASDTPDFQGMLDRLAPLVRQSVMA
jgi:hypothetical protein